jgi:hypothetical protein
MCNLRGFKDDCYDAVDGHQPGGQPAVSNGMCAIPCRRVWGNRWEGEVKEYATVTCLDVPTVGA